VSERPLALARTTPNAVGDPKRMVVTPGHAATTGARHRPSSSKTGTVRIIDWLSIDWRHVEDDVRRLRQRIFTASRNGDLKKVRNLQKLTAPRGALSYSRRSREELEGRYIRGALSRHGAG
jgi:hypothetical protein